jgi:hypothetical protein
MKKSLFAIVIAVATLQGCNSNLEGGCEQYASKFSCDFVQNKATYEVWYWKDVHKGNDYDNKFVGMASGLSNCRDIAIYAHRSEMEYRKKNWNNWSDRNDNWSERSYICALMKDGSRLEKHRM